MKMQITARKCDVSQTIRDRAEELAGRWPRFEPALSGVQIVFSVDGREHDVEAILSLDRMDRAAAKGRGDDFRKALDDLDKKVSKILRRQHQKRTDHSAVRPSKAEA